MYSLISPGSVKILSYQLTKQITKNKEYSTIKSIGVRNNYHIDIMYLPNPSTTAIYKYLLNSMGVYIKHLEQKPERKY